MFEKSCGAIVFDGNLVLLVKHRSGHTAFPKGHVEGDETEWETAKREILEETNIVADIDPNYRYSSTYSPKEGVIKEVIYFLGKKISGEIISQESEITESMWVPKDEVLKYLTYDDVKDIYCQLLIDSDK